MTPVNDDPTLPDEDAEPQPPVGHVRVVYLGPVAPHWEVRSDFGDPALIEEFRRRTNARLVLLPPHDPQYRRNRERVIRDAERENILIEWDLGLPEEEPPTPAADAAPATDGRRDAGTDTPAQPTGPVSRSGRRVRAGRSAPATVRGRPPRPGSGRFRTGSHSRASASSPARSTTPATNARPRSTWACSRSRPNERTGRLLALAPLGPAAVPGLGELGVGADQLHPHAGWRCGRRRRRRPRRATSAGPSSAVTPA